MEVDVKGKRVVVAGGSRGIGRSIALAFAEGGAKVSICARGAAALEATRAELAARGPFAHAQTCDLGDDAAINRYIPAAAEALGGIDVLVNNATGAALGDDEASWDADLAVDLRAVVRASRAALPYLLKGNEPSIVNISSISGLHPAPRAPAYGAAKAAVIHYTQTQAATLAAKGVRVNCVTPGSIEFPGGSWERRKTEEPDIYKRTLASMPTGRLGRPEEVANVVLFLASPLAIWVTAQVISVSGGQGLGR
ncbi:SDR family NAD(P)-dependent oxidoreductase [Usitatibacter palustris]|uniref:Dihydroanticapsin 7-dehydrogenase n=1 Tax=Usitatibacter palustris TaxID=2732487 RepID=A0A6M4H3C3_9PROT|nr:SDR family NAD(P)-dependent oxidoreductase [Usitatibacter palustris]QJR13578.1 Dihydroanticapsin 7-dehydrogenase [Usitatibacter palustris]